MDKQLTDHDVQLFFDAAEKLRNAAEWDYEKSRKATNELITYTDATNARFLKIEREVTASIHRSAEETAERIAILLGEKFQHANKHAEEASSLYLDAVKRLNVRRWAYFVGAQLVLVAITALLITTLVPSLSEIQSRRSELSFLNNKIDENNLEWSRCQTDDGSQRCFRTDKKAGTTFNAQDGSTWLIPKKK